MDYKATLNLPRTDFPMKANLPQREPELLALWEREGLYQRIQDAGHDRPVYLLHDGPPYANGRIHIGHALNKILKDIVVKSKTMAGFRAPYIPGWDCHGLPIEHQVMKELGEKKKDLDTLTIRKLCREYAQKYVEIQREEFRRLGVLGDWDDPYLTMAPAYEATILREFGAFVEKGLIYKGLKPVLWCMVDQTALAEAEVEYENHTSPSIYVKFPLIQSPDDLHRRWKIELPPPVRDRPISMVIWTTTPWTLPANQALCVNADYDYAFAKVSEELLVIASKRLEPVSKECGFTYELVGEAKGFQLAPMAHSSDWLRCRRPFSDRLSPILRGDFVTLEQGTGCVHIAPGHGQEDYELALLTNSTAPSEDRLEIFAPVDDTGRFTNEVSEFAGQPVFKANGHIVQSLHDKGRLLNTKALSITHSYPHCWRCKNPVIFRATEQWFVSMDYPMSGESLRQRALHDIDERVRWIPPWGRDRIYGMIENRPDWCLSRQRTWGTPIPAFLCGTCRTPLVNPAVIKHVVDVVARHGTDVWFEKPASELLPSETSCPQCRAAVFEKEHDILDVWFESGVSHAAVLKAPDDPRRGGGWWPADLYLEGSDQHRGWFHSSLLTAIVSDGRAPYRAVLTHGFVVDGAGKKMSKSAGNVVAPQDVIKQFGAEILRLWVSAQDYREDLRISPEILSQLVEAYRKIRNTCRFLLSNLYDFDATRDGIPYGELSELDRWALLRLAELIPRVRRAYEEFEFHAIFHALNNFCSVDLSAVYLDILKDRLYTFRRDHRLRRGAQTVLLELLVALTKLMAPILSFTAEEIWRLLPESVKAHGHSIHLTTFPESEPAWLDSALAQRWEQLLQLRSTVQNSLEEKRRDKLIGSSLEAKVLLRARADRYDFLKRYEHELASLFIVSEVELLSESTRGPSDAAEISVQVTKSLANKCERCWNYLPSVGQDREHPTLCHRCLEAVR